MQYMSPQLIKQVSKGAKNLSSLPTVSINDHGICITYLNCICNNHIIEPRHELFNNVECAISKGSDQPAHKHSLIRAFASRLNILRLLTY